MAQTPRETLLALTRGFNQLSNGRKIGLIAGVAGVIALVVVLLISAGRQEYKVLFANIAEKDGGAIISQLAQMNVPYRIAEGGGAILVPSDMVYKVRLQLAAQGLPKSGGVGFELMESQKFGVSQFVEQVNYQRALEGHLARTIQAMPEIEEARVHLAIPRPSVFVRESQKPSAAILVQLRPGRVLDPGQVAGVVHLVSSAIPELSPRQVTVVDQRGNLLSGAADDTGVAGLDRKQLEYLHQVENSIVRRIESILKPITGPDNVRAQVAATLDFSEVEQTSESFKPNSDVKDQAIRSQQSTDNQSSTPQPPQGVPGALSNTPPGAAAAPLVAPQAGAQPAGTPVPMATTAQKDSTINFELDKTIRHMKGEVGAVKRLSVAVVVNHKKLVQDGKSKLQPFSDPEMAQITNLVREAMGYSKERGDTVNVVNAPFRIGVEEDDVPFWKDPANIPIAMEAGKWLVLLGLGLTFLLIVRAGVRDVVKLAQPPEPVTEGAGADGGSGGVAGDGEGAVGEGGTGGEGATAAEAAPEPPHEETEQERQLRLMRAIAKENPRLAAQIIKNWVTGDG
jgi:flagellar M-ring protein FliF